ncbi:MAG: hypothetical protein KDA45_15605 [Planctomycetales bacterium]|nr:hypothetical protein [Planctomycetales bacterium]
MDNKPHHIPGDLDLTSEPYREPQPPGGNQPSPAARARHASSGGRASVLFSCCRVYAYVKIPPNVLSGQLSSWRFHCPRCGKLVEIPL